MRLKDVIFTQREAITGAAARYGATNVRLFGSAVRGEDTGASDVDFLVTFPPNGSLLDLCGLAVELEAMLGREVEVVADDHLRPRVRARILREAVAL